jgi:hypothetical protein
VNLPIVNSFQSEWLKTRHSLSSWLVVVGGLFTPSVVVLARLLRHDRLQGIYAADNFWNLLWRNSWESMAVFFLPMGAVLATSLITQIEYKNNAWKQVHTLPLGITTIFLSKLAVILVMLAQMFVVFGIGIYLSAVIPSILVPHLPYPRAPIPFRLFLKDDARYFIDCLPIVALQYLISLRFKNFLVPVGVGFVLWVGALASLPWKYSFVVPYTYCMVDYLKDDPSGKVSAPAVDIHSIAIGYFLLFAVAALILFATKREKG